MRKMILILSGVAVLAGCGTSDPAANNGNLPVPRGEGDGDGRSNGTPLPAQGVSGVYGRDEVPEMTEGELFRFRRQVAQMNATSSRPKSEQVKASDLLKLEMHARSKSNNLSQSDAFSLQRQLAQLKATGE